MLAYQSCTIPHDSCTTAPVAQLCGTLRRPSVPFPHSVVVLLNSSSGERLSHGYVLRYCIRTFGEEHVVSLFHTDTHQVEFDVVKEVLVRVKPRVVLVAGGDGTASLALTITQTLRKKGDIGPCECAVAIIPTGTCNDLSRVLGYGPGYSRMPFHGSSKLKKLIDRVYRGYPIPVDQFKAHFTLIANPRQMCSRSMRCTTSCGAEPVMATTMCGPPCCCCCCRCIGNSRHSERENVDCSTGPVDANASARLYPARTAGSPSSLVSKEWDGPVFTNYLSTGFDAEVLHNFDQFRKSHARLCSTRLTNYLVYAVCGIKSLFCTSPFPSARVYLRIDGQEIQIPHSAKSIEISSMLCYAGGVVLWRDQDRTYHHPSISDKMLEVCALNGALNLLGCMMHVCKATKLGQGRIVELRVPACSYVQYDGEILDMAGAYYDDLVIRVSHEWQSVGFKVDRTFMKEWDDKFASCHTPR